MTSHDIFLDHIEPGGIVVATNNADEVPTGTVFSLLVKTRYEGVRGYGQLIELWSAPISLRLNDVFIFRKSVPAIPRGWSAGLVLEGSGIDKVEVAIREKQKGEFIHLRGTNAA